MTRTGSVATEKGARTIGVSEFKLHALEILEKLRRQGGELIITKRGEPIARVIPFDRRHRPLRGLWRDRIEIRGERRRWRPPTFDDSRGLAADD